LQQIQGIGYPPGNASFTVESLKKSRSSSAGNRSPAPATIFL
jgi:hypothetical protein